MKVLYYLCSYTVSQLSTFRNTQYYNHAQLKSNIKYTLPLHYLMYQLVAKLVYRILRYKKLEYYTNLFNKTSQNFILLSCFTQTNKE